MLCELARSQIFLQVSRAGCMACTDTVMTTVSAGDCTSVTMIAILLIIWRFGDFAENRQIKTPPKIANCVIRMRLVSVVANL